MKSHASMNRIYRLVWNAALSLWVAVAENAKGRSKGGSARSSVLFGSAPDEAVEGEGGGAGFRLNSACRAALVLLASLAVLTHEAHAADAANASVTAGAAGISTVGNTTTINQSTQRVAIDWTSLSTAANEALRFNQPNAAAIALNRITGSSPSELLGSLTANGQVFILNPNGVLFGAGSQVNVGGLVASTLSMSNADFMAGNHVFTGSGGSGSVVNQGTLTAANGGYIALLAPEVRNEGVIGATLGTALLAAGNKVTLNIDNGSLLGYSIDQGAVNALAENKHLIQADGGQVLLSAKAMDSLTAATVNNTGVIEAKTLQNKAGRIMLMGDMETGTVNVGGTLDASAPDGGDGGFVETSAAHVKVASGTRVTTTAPNGQTGKWLIDPNDFTIAASGGDMDAATVAANLGSTNFEIQTATMGTAGGNGDIFVNEDLSWSGTNTLTLTAERNIALNNAITANNGGLTLNATGSISAPAAVNVGTFTLANGYWNQTGVLPAFSAADFRINGGTFLRSLGGAGNSASPLQLADIYGLQGMASAGMLGSFYALANDVDATVTSGWNGGAGFVPVGDSTTKFTGGFDGQNHTIGNLYINRPGMTEVGLFGNVYGNGFGTILKNVKFTGATITGYDRVGTLVGYANGNMPSNMPIDNVSSEGATINATRYYAGGIVGYMVTGTLSNAHFNGTARANDSAGGIAGLTNNVTTTNVSSAGTVNGWGPVSGGYGGSAGGVIGTQQYGGVSSAFSTSNVTGGNRVGGLVGWNFGNVSFSFATGAVTGGTYVGGLVGHNGRTGINAGNIGSSYSTGAVSGGSSVGGLVGLQETGGVNSSFWDAQASGQASSAGSASTSGKTSVEMKQAATFTDAGWDVATQGGSSSVWRIYEGNTGPLIRSLLTAASVTANAASEVYNGANHTTVTNAVYTGLTGGDTGTQGTLGYGSNAINVGTYGLSGLWSTKYDISYSGGALSVTPYVVNLSGSRTYDGTTGVAAGILNMGPLVGTETLILSGAGTVDKNAGSGKTVTLGTLTLSDGSNGGLASNYTFTGGTQAVDINRANLTVTANAVTKTYDGTLGATGTGTVGALAGVAAGELVDSSGSQAFLDKNFGVGNKAVRASGVTIKDAGNADVTGNYNIAYVDDTTSTINRADVTLSTSNVTKTYDGGLSAAGTVVVTAGTIFAGDSATGGTFAFTDKNAGSGNKTVTTSGFTVGDGVNNANYNVSYVDNTASTINKANLTVTANAVTKTYDGTLAAAGSGTVDTLAGAGAGESVNAAATQVFTDKNFGIGNKTVQASGLTIKDSGNADVTGNYNIAYVDNTTSTINKADLTVTANAVTKTYDGTLGATGTGTVGALAGVAAGELVDSSGSQAFLDKNFGVGNKAVRASGVTIKDAGNADVTGNYNIAYVDDTTSTINKADVTLSTSNVTKTYDGGLSAAGTVVVTAGTIFAGDSATGGTFAFTDKNAGSGNKTVTTSGFTVGDGVNNANYNVSYVDNTASTINKANVTLSTSDVTKTYDGGLSAAGTVVVTAGTIFTGDNATGGTFAFTDKNAGSGNKTVTTSGFTVSDGVNNANYNVSYADNTTSTINRANLTVTATGVTKTYDGTTSATGTGSVGALAGAAAGEVVNTAATQVFTDKNAGSGNKTVQASGLTIKDSGNADVTGNYNIAYVDNTTSTINKANLTVTATGVTKTYDGTTSATGTGTVAALAGAAAGEVVDAAGSQAFLDKNFGIGNKTVRASGVTIKDSGNADVTGNYNIAYVDDTTSTINKADVTLSTSDVTKTYDGGLSANGTVIVTSGTIFAGDSATGGTFAFTNRNVGNGIRTVTTSGVTVGDGVNNGNYNVSYADNMSSTINQANLVLTTSNVAKSYDGTTSASGIAQATGGTALLGGDSLSGGSFAFTDKNAGSGNKTVTAAGVTVHDGNGGNNYNISYVDNTTSTINRANLTVTATAVTKTYDGTTSATGTGTVAALAGAAAGEVVDAAGGQAFLDKNFGVGNKTVRASGVTIKDSGNADVTGNYNIAYVDNTTSTINKANLTVTATGVTKTYDGTTSATGTGTVAALAGAAAGEVVDAAGSQAFLDKNFGIGNKTVRASGVTIKDASNADVTGNYNIAYVDDTTSTINKANLTLSTSDVTKTYDGTTSATGAVVVTAGTVFAGDSTTGGSFAFTDKNVGMGNKTVTTSGVTVGDGVNNANYNVSYADNTTSTINRANLTVTATGVTKTYDGTTSATGTGSVGALAGAAAGEVVNTAATQVFTDKNAGSGNKTVQASGLTIKDSGNADVTGNYNIAYVDNTTSTINKANLTVTATGVTKTYDGTTSATGTGTVAALAGAAAGEVVDAAGSQAFLDKNFGIGNKTVRASGVTIKDSGNADVTGNYNIAYVDDTTSTINKADVTLSTSGVTKTYDGGLSAAGTVVVTAGTVFAGDNTSGGSFAFTDKNVGSGNKTVTTSGVTVGDGVNNANYNVTYADNTSSTINQANLTLTTTNVTKTYDGTTSAVGTATVAAGTLFTGDSLTGGSFAFTDKNAGAGNKTVTTAGVTVGDGVNNGNYNVSYVDNITSTINKANLTVTATAVTKTYDGTTSATGTGSVGTLAGAGAGESVNAAATQTFTDKNFGVGNKTVQAGGLTIKDSGNADVTGNYNIAYVDNTASTINKANVTLSTSDVTKTYDGTTSAAGTVVVTAGTVFAGDNATGGSFAFTDKNAGTGNKTVTTNGVTVGDGVNNANYNISYADNTTSTINQANLTVSTTNVTKTYDGNTTAAGTATVTGGTLFTGDSLAGGSFAFTDKNAGNGNKTVLASGVTVGDGVNNGNYNVTYADNTTSTINPFAVSVSGTRTYDGTANVAAGVLNIGPLVAGETLGLTGTATMADKNVGANKALTVAGLSLVDGTGLASNYTFTGGTQQASITQASITVGSSNVTKTYDGNLSAAGAATVTAGTLFSGDNLTGGTFAFTDKNAGTGNKTVTTTGVTVGDGVNNGNYAVSYVNNTTSTIDKANLTVTATGVNKVYDGSTVAAVTYGDNRVAGDVVGITGSATFADKNAGTGKAVGVNGIALGGTDAGNYNLLNTSATTTASITPKALTVTANGDTKLYDGSAYSGGNGVSYNGFVAGDTQADIGGALAYGGSSQGAVAAGNYLITPGGLSSISGNYALGFVDGTLSIMTSNASTAAVGNAGLVSSYDAALQSVAGVGGSFGGGGGFSGDAAADALAAAIAQADKTGEE